MWLLADEKKSLEILKRFLKTSTKKVVAVEVLALWSGGGLMRGGGGVLFYLFLICRMNYVWNNSDKGYDDYSDYHPD